MVQILPFGTNTTVTISSDTSAALPLVCNDPQGLVVGPLLFITYTYDIIDTVDVYYLEHELYADDAKYYQTCV